MTAVTKPSGKKSEVRLEDKPLANPELVFSPRPMVGFFYKLTAEQKAQALAYRGEENHGDSECVRLAPSS